MPHCRAMPRVDVVIPNWNGRALLESLLPTLAAQTFTDFRVIVVDNGSEDGSVEFLDDREGHVLALPENVGFPPAINRGVAHGTAEYVALLNTDMELDPRWLEALVDALDSDPELAAATPKQLMAQEPGRIDGAGDVMAWTGGTTRRGAG